MLTVRKRIQIAGVVQGVGFRPFVWRLANELGCTGSIFNNASGVQIEVQGTPTCVDEFQRRLQAESPTSARIAEVVVAECDIEIGVRSFEIVDSRRSERFTAGVAPDLSVCNECLGELREPTNRRFAYPFINCTNCGPRFTIIESLPYDRLRTSMHRFDLHPHFPK